MTPTGTTGAANPRISPIFPNPEPASRGGMTLQAGQRMAVTGQLVWVPVWLVDASGVANVNVAIGYNAQVAVPEGEVVAGNMLREHAFSANVAQTGTLLVGFAGDSDLTGTGTVAWIPFVAVGTPGQRTPLTVTVTTVNAADGAVLDIQQIDGEILVVSEDFVILGDCNGDSIMTELDALCALQMSVQLIPQQTALDLDASGAVNSRDAVVILQRALGK